MHTFAMNFGNPILLGIIGSVLLVLVVWIGVSFFSPEAKLDRRRRKSNAKVIHKAARPTVKFSVKTGEGKSQHKSQP